MFAESDTPLLPLPAPAPMLPDPGTQQHRQWWAHMEPAAVPQQPGGLGALHLPSHLQHLQQSPAGPVPQQLANMPQPAGHSAMQQLLGSTACPPVAVSTTCSTPFKTYKVPGTLLPAPASTQPPQLYDVGVYLTEESKELLLVRWRLGGIVAFTMVLLWGSFFLFYVCVSVSLSAS